ncbi:MAG: YHYH protein, partial [Caldilineaceae bacterium]
MLDFCNGHTGPSGDYHFHARPECLFTDFEGNTSLVVAYALDGYPILAPYVCEDNACTAVKEVQSSWQRISNVTAAWDAHEYVAGSGDLDRCNGTTLADGSYAYFAIDSFPYFLACYHGNATQAAGGNPGGGPGGPPGPNAAAGAGVN